MLATRSCRTALTKIRVGMRAALSPAREARLHRILACLPVHWAQAARRARAVERQRALRTPGPPRALGGARCPLGHTAPRISGASSSRSARVLYGVAALRRSLPHRPAKAHDSVGPVM